MLSGYMPSTMAGKAKRLAIFYISRRERLIIFAIFTPIKAGNR
jgi:hypothetical protein